MTYACLKLCSAAIAAGVAATASAGTHQMVVTQVSGISDKSGIDMSVTISQSADGFVFDVLNNSTDGSVITGVYFEMDEVAGRDWDMRQYVKEGTIAADGGSASSASVGSFQSFVGWEGSDLSGLKIAGDTRSTVIPLWYLDNAVTLEDYRIGYTIQNSEGTGFVATGYNTDAESLASLDGLKPSSMPTPTSAAAGLGLLFGLAARRRRRQA